MQIIDHRDGMCNADELTQVVLFGIIEWCNACTYGKEKDMKMTDTEASVILDCLHGIDELTSNDPDVAHKASAALEFTTIPEYDHLSWWCDWRTLVDKLNKQLGTK